MKKNDQETKQCILKDFNKNQNFKQIYKSYQHQKEVFNIESIRISKRLSNNKENFKMLQYLGLKEKNKSKSFLEKGELLFSPKDQK